jgi:DNA (cytosine-5)-methyltransferase 1
MNFIEVCAGAGGLSSGFINVGFVPVAMFEINKQCCETLKTNHKEYSDIIKCIDMNNIDTTKYKNIDVMMGGVPCQSYSQAGMRKGLDDPRGNLLVKFISQIHEIKPKVFLIENVKGLLTHNKRKTFNFILENINSYGLYNIKYAVLNANNYSVPQKRERLIIIGTLKSIPNVYEFPNHHDYKPVLSDVLKDVPESSGTSYSKRKQEIMNLVPQGGCWVNLPLDIQREYMKGSFNSGGGKRGIARRLSMDAPGLTLTCSPTQTQTERCHPIETRPLTIREYARIQTFKDSYEFIGSISSCYSQIGNAVPVLMAEALAESIKNFLVFPTIKE